MFLLLGPTGSPPPPPPTTTTTLFLWTLISYMPLHAGTVLSHRYSSCLTLPLPFGCWLLLTLTPPSRHPALPPTCPFFILALFLRTLPVSWALASPDTIFNTAHSPCAHPTLCSILRLTDRERRAPAGSSPMAARRQQLLGFLLGPCQGEATSVPQRPLPEAASPAPRTPFP